MKIVLASSSPRRRELLTWAGLEFTVRTTDTNEDLDASMKPEDYVLELAKRKAMDAVCGADELIVAADTVVALGDRIFGKPKDAADAFETLKTFSGKTNVVYTGVALRQAETMECFVSRTEVNFYDLSDGEIWDYIATGEPLDKAGSYGIQGKGGLFVKSISGDYSNAVGLPVAELMQRLKAFL